MTDATIRPEDIRWRVSNTWGPDDKKMGMLVGYIDARTAMDALDDLDEHWTMRHGIPVVVGNELLGVPGELTVNNVTRSDVGMPSSQEPIKGAYSDCLKRCAVHFGIGRELYELPKIAVQCEVDQRTKKVKAPKALPTYRSGRWHIESKYGWVKYDREPDDQPERVRGGLPSSPNAPAPVQYRRGELAVLMVEHNLDNDAVLAVADRIGIPKDERPMSNESMDRLIEAIETPQSDSSPAVATAQAPVSPPGGEPAPAPTDEQILDVTGGEFVKPRTVEEAIADAESKAKKSKTKVPA